MGRRGSVAPLPASSIYIYILSKYPCTGAALPKGETLIIGHRKKTYFYQKVGLDIPDLSSNNTKKNLTDLPDPMVPFPGPYLPS